MGDFLTGLTMPVLNEAGKIIIRNEIERNRELQYNVNKEDRGNGNISNERASEEGADNERFGIHRSERILDAEFGNERGTGGTSRNNRENEESVAQREPTRTLFSFTNARGTESSLSRSGEESGRDDTLFNQENGNGRGSNGSTQERGSTGLGSEDELNKGESKGYKKVA